MDPTDNWQDIPYVNQTTKSHKAHPSTVFIMLPGNGQPITGWHGKVVHRFHPDFNPGLRYIELRDNRGHVWREGSCVGGVETRTRPTTDGYVWQWRSAVVGSWLWVEEDMQEAVDKMRDAIGDEMPELSRPEAP